MRINMIDNNKKKKIVLIKNIHAFPLQLYGDL